MLICSRIRKGYIMRMLGYVRVSTLKQIENTSILEQTKAIKQFCKLQGYELVDIIQDSDSGGKLNRNGFTCLLNRLKTDSFDGVASWKIDRLYRGLSSMAELFKLVEKKNKFIHTTDGVDTRQPMGNYLAKQLGLLGELESKTIAERLHSGRMSYFLETGKTGKEEKNTTGYAPFGFSWVRGELAQDESKIKKVKKLYKLYVGGWSIGTLARSLSQTEQTRYGNPFTRQGLRKTLKSRYYIGQVQYNGEVFRDHHKAVISKAIWNKANKLLKTKGYQGKRIRKGGNSNLPTI